MIYRKREAESILLELAEHYPVVSITGPRQSGKTTLSQTLFKEKNTFPWKTWNKGSTQKKIQKDFFGSLKTD